MRAGRLAALTALTMLAFAANSLLCREALRAAHCDAASFTAVRIASAALALWALLKLRGARAEGPAATPARRRGSRPAACALFVYAAGFSFAYLALPASVGALLLFAAVQATMVGYGLLHGEQLTARQALGLVLAFAGLVCLLLPGLEAPPLDGAMLMLAAGAAWGVYSLLGRGRGDPAADTAGNFIRALPPAAALLAVMAATPPRVAMDPAGLVLAVASGALASGLGYALWYAVLPHLSATRAAAVQLSVPVIAAAGGALLLGEAVTLRLAISSAAVLGGIALAVLGPRRA